MKIGLNLLCLSGHITIEHLPQIEVAKAAGFSGVEVPIFSGDDTHYQMLGQRIANIGLECTCSTALLEGEHGAGLLSNHIETRELAINRMVEIIDSAAALGAKIVCGPLVVAVGHFSGSSRTEDEWNRAVEAHKYLAEYASSAGIVLSFEPLNRFETYFINTMEDAAAFASAVDHLSFKILYDTFHANIEEKDPIAAYDHVRKHIGNIHFAENDRGIPGAGHIDFPAMCRKLRSTGYDGWLTIEAFSQGLPELAAATRIWRPLYKDFDTLAVQGFNYVEKCWADAAP